MLSPVISDVSTLKANSGKIKYGIDYKDAATYFEYYAIKDLAAAPPSYGYGCQAQQTWCTGDGKWAVVYGYKPGQTDATKVFYIVNLNTYTTYALTQNAFNTLLYLDNSLAIFGKGNSSANNISLGVYKLNGSNPSNVYTGTIIGYCYHSLIRFYSYTQDWALSVVKNVSYDKAYFVVHTSYSDHDDTNFTVYAYDSNTKTCYSVGTIPKTNSYSNYITYVVCDNGKILYRKSANTNTNSSTITYYVRIGDFYNGVATDRATISKTSSSSSYVFGMFYSESRNTFYVAGDYDGNNCLVAYNYNTMSLKIGPNVAKYPMLLGSDNKIYVGSSIYNLDTLALEQSNILPIPVANANIFCKSSDIDQQAGIAVKTKSTLQVYSLDAFTLLHVPLAGYYTTGTSTITIHGTIAAAVSCVPLSVPVLLGKDFILFGNLFERRRVVSIPA